MIHPIIRIQIENSIYDRLVAESVKYALISLPYTINRMSLKDIQARITNIAKGKISEKLFLHFCEQNEIPVKTKKCQTSFYLPDKRDFILGREEWDIKNNYLRHEDDILSPEQYFNLPALIPNRGEWDQWSKKDQCFHAPSTDTVCYMFSFMKGWKGKIPFLSIELTEGQNAFIIKLIQSARKKGKPYDEKWFWLKMTELGNGIPFKYHLNFHPELILCGLAQEKDFSRFNDLKPQNFQNGLFKTRIQNKGIKIKHLSSFLTLYPRLKEKMEGGVLID
jgi:hypothetical protein